MNEAARVWCADVGEHRDGDRERRQPGEEASSHRGASYTASLAVLGNDAHVDTAARCVSTTRRGVTRAILEDVRMKRLIIAIDGPSGAGKGTVSRALAQALGYRHIDTGAMYRAVGWKANHDGIPLNDEAAVARLARAATSSWKAESSRSTVTT